MTRKLRLEEIKDILHMDTISRRSGIITVRHSYYYRFGKTVESYEARIKEHFPNAKILESGDHFASFRGVQSVVAGSHFFVKFILEEQAQMKQEVN